MLRVHKWHYQILNLQPASPEGTRSLDGPRAGPVPKRWVLCRRSAWQKKWGCQKSFSPCVKTVSTLPAGTWLPEPRWMSRAHFRAAGAGLVTPPSEEPEGSSRLFGCGHISDHSPVCHRGAILTPSFCARFSS